MVEGITLHGGIRSRVRLFQDDGEVRFRRNGRDIPAHIGAVVSTDRCTVLGEGPARIAVVEHLLAALHVLSLWRGVVIEVDTDELPILDGSAEPWLPALEPLSREASSPPAFRPTTPTHRRHGSSEIRVDLGARGLCSEIHFPHPAIGRQRWCGAPDTYDRLLPARTFGFLHEAATLRRAGLASGASLENAIIFSDEGPLSPLRFPDEPVRHKALDTLGDLFLLGGPLEGKLTVTRGSHRLHVDFLNHLIAEGVLEADQ